MPTNKGVQKSKFKERAVSAVELFTDRCGNPKKVLANFKYIYDNYVPTRGFIHKTHEDYRVIEELLENIIAARADE